MDIDPQITVVEALEFHNGNQSSLARELDLARNTVNEWVQAGREFIPTVHAYRLQKLHPEVFVEAA